MEKGTKFLNGHFYYKPLPHGGVDKTKAICNHCKAELSYHLSISSLKYHLNAMHTVDASDSKWELHSHALAVMKTKERHFAETCAEHFIHVAQQWDVLNKVSTLSTDGARNMIAAF